MRRLCDLEEADLRCAFHGTEQQRSERATQREHARRCARLQHECEDRPAVVSEGLGRVLREAAEGEPAGHADRGGGDELGDQDARDRPGEAVMRADRDRREPQGHRPREEGRANVVTASEKKRRRGQPLERVPERNPGGNEEGHGQPRGPERGEDQQTRASCGGARELHPKPGCKEAPQPPPVFACDVPEAVLDECLLDREVEERLQERGREQDRREVPEVELRMEHSRRNHGAEEAEDDGRVDADGRQRTADDEPGHRARAV